jgi:hypothetical protein
MLAGKDYSISCNPHLADCINAVASSKRFSVDNILPVQKPAHELLLFLGMT